MRLSFKSSARKLGLLGISLSLAAVYTVLVGLEWVAAHLSDRADLASLQAAVRLQPGNAEYRHRLGRYFALIAHDPPPAAEQYKASVRLKPQEARYWFDLANTYQVLGDIEGQEQALEHAIQADPTTPDVAWEAANLYLVRGETDKALREFRVVLENDPYLPSAALQLCWRVNPDVDALLRQVVPPRIEVYVAFLDFLLSRKETEAAGKVWAGLAQLHQPFVPDHAYNYIRYLVLQQQVEQARMVWEQAAGLLGLSAYLPSANNLIVNGQFSLDVLNGGFDWQYRNQPAVHLALDPSDYHGGHRSLSIVFDGPGVSDAGIFQMIPVQPNTGYEFSAYFKTGEMDGAGGPHFSIQDLYGETPYFLSEELRNAAFWKQVTGEFTTGPSTKLLVLRVQRLPAGNAIRGRLWIDDFRLVQKQPGRERL